jgi:hypothetical protein
MVVCDTQLFPRAIMPSRLALVVGYYTSESVPILNPIVVDSKLECNQLLIQLE